MFASQPMMNSVMNPALGGNYYSMGGGNFNNLSLGAPALGGSNGSSYQMDPSMQMMIQQNAQMTMMTEMMEMLMMILMGGMLGQQMGGNNAFGSNPGSGMGGGFSPGGSGMGNVGGSSPANGTSSVVPMGSAGQGNDAAVNLGRKFLGNNAIDIKGKLSHFTAAGGQTNNCADFVSSLLESTGGLKGHHVGVRDLESSLKSQGYHQVPASQAKPGDVWISKSRSHTEMVTAKGGTRCIGSNNDRPGHQVISEKPMDPNAGVYYTRG